MEGFLGFLLFAAVIVVPIGIIRHIRKEEENEGRIRKVNALKLLRDYKENRSASDTEYKGYKALVTGTVDEVGNFEKWVKEGISYDSVKEYAIRIGEGEDEGRVYCFIDIHNPTLSVANFSDSIGDLMGLKKGDEINIAGRVFGLDAKNKRDIYLDECRLIPETATPAEIETLVADKGGNSTSRSCIGCFVVFIVLWIIIALISTCD